MQVRVQRLLAADSEPLPPRGSWVTLHLQQGEFRHVQVRAPQPKQSREVARVLASIPEHLMSQQAAQRFNGTLVVDPSKVFVGKEHWPRIRASLEDLRPHRPRHD